MWSVQSDKIKQHKKRVNYTINKNTIDRFKIVADKDMRKMSNIVENLIVRYVESRVQFLGPFELNEQKQIINLNRVEVFERVRDLRFDNNQLYLFMEDTASIGVINLD